MVHLSSFPLLFSPLASLRINLLESPAVFPCAALWLVCYHCPAGCPDVQGFLNFFLQTHNFPTATLVSKALLSPPLYSSHLLLWGSTAGKPDPHRLSLAPGLLACLFISWHRYTRIWEANVCQLSLSVPFSLCGSIMCSTRENFYAVIRVSCLFCPAQGICRPHWLFWFPGNCCIDIAFFCFIY